MIELHFTLFCFCNNLHQLIFSAFSCFFRIVSKAKIEASSAKTSIWIEDALINHLLLYQRIKLYECKILRETDIYIEKSRTIWKTGNLKLFFGINS